MTVIRMKISDLVKSHVKYGCKDSLYVILYDDFDRLVDNINAEDAVRQYGSLDVIKWFERSEITYTTIHIIVSGESVVGIG